MSTLVTVAIIAVGYFLGGFLAWGASRLESREFLGTNVYSLLAGSFYFACLFSAPLSGNMALFIIMVGILLYTLYGGFAARKLEPKKPEDKVVSKWYPGYP